MPTPPPLPALNPYAAPDAAVAEPVVEGIELASRGTRFLAALVDGLVFSIPYFATIVAFPAFGAGGLPDDTQLALVGVVGLAGFIAVAAVNLVLLHRHGQTIAKRMFGIKVVRTDGTRCSVLRIVFARWLPVTVMTMIPLLGFIVALADPLMIFREDHRCMHDHIADTIVVRA
jgi:uncharacterized RDD family membrane protein YckC